MEARKIKIEQVKQNIELLMNELEEMKKSCLHESTTRIEDYAYCEICGERLGWWGLYN